MDTEGWSRINRQIGQNLRRLRLTAGLTQCELAESLGLSFQQCQKYESGKNRMSAATLYRLACVFGCGYQEFFAGLEKPTAFDARHGVEMFVVLRWSRALVGIKDRALRESLLTLACQMARME